MLDYHVILDLLPTLSALYFSQRFPEDIKLSGVQSSILLALGLQRKPVEDIEVSLQSSNSLLRFDNLIRLFALKDRAPTARRAVACPLR